MKRCPWHLQPTDLLCGALVVKVVAHPGLEGLGLPYDKSHDDTWGVALGLRAGGFWTSRGFWGAGGLGVVVVGGSLVASGRGGQTGLTPPPAGPGLGATGQPGLSPAPCPVTLTSAELSSTVYSVQDRSL